MNNKKSLITLILGTALTACGSVPSTSNIASIEPIPYEKVCCNRYAEFPWVELQSNESIEFDIDESAPIGHFSDGNSYFNAFKLPHRSAKVQVRLSSYMLNKSVFSPKVIMLDKAFNIVSETELSQFDVETSDAFTRNQYRLDFKVDATKTPYFVIYTPEQYLGQKVKVDHPAKVRAKELGEAMPMVTDPTYVSEHFGKLKLEIKTLSLQSYQAEKSAEKHALKAVSEQTEVTAIVQPETKNYYISAIENAVNTGDVAKALSLLDEAKMLNIDGAQQAFIKAVNAK
ncbi:MalM family protein [Vibrio aestuarianus]|uniref:MalM family protein n=1 Tax=Vibrio aestuarianus TaxID=28171 RepID=A0ABD7YQW2_9VIBR|nr:MalM family protein [Vibrio aestuarianus]WGK86764.1 MalM family protein [Vibrio aestuarianus]CAH8210940.1 Maltose operon periplasmic protein precursor [Vibrio aestuarianus]